MGGMLSLVTIRKGLAKNDYKNHGWHKHPTATMTCGWASYDKAMLAVSDEFDKIIVPQPSETLLKVRNGGSHAGYWLARMSSTVDSGSFY